MELVASIDIKAALHDLPQKTTMRPSSDPLQPRLGAATIFSLSE